MDLPYSCAFPGLALRCGAQFVDIWWEGQDLKKKIEYLNFPKLPKETSGLFANSSWKMVIMVRTACR
jgi:hypothetical protein